MKTKWLTLGLLSTALLVACGGNGDAPPTSEPTEEPDPSDNESIEEEVASVGDGDIEITFMGHGNPTETAIFTQLVEAFVEDHPDVEVTYISVPPNEYSQRLVAMAASGNLPDVFYAAGPEFNRFVEADILLNVQEFLDVTDTFNPDNVWEEALDRYRFDGDLTGSGDLYGLPKDLGPWAFVYNKDLFDEAGLDYPSTTPGEWTWDDMIEAAQAIAQDTNDDGRTDQFGVASYSLEAAVWANGGEFIDYETGEVKVNEPEFAEGMQMVADLINEYNVAPSPEDAGAQNEYSRWVDGSIGMFAMGPWDQPAFWDLEFEWDIAAWPASPNTNETATWVGSMGFVISESTDHPQEAFELASYLALDEEGQRTNYELGQAIPNLIDMTENEYLNTEQDPESKEVFIDIIEDYGRPGPEWRSVDTEWLDTFHQEASRVWGGGETAEEFLNDIQPRLQEMYDRGHE